MLADFNQWENTQPTGPLNLFSLEKTTNAKPVKTQNRFEELSSSIHESENEKYSEDFEAKTKDIKTEDEGKEANDWNWQVICRKKNKGKQQTAKKRVYKEKFEERNPGKPGSIFYRIDLRI